MIFDAGEWDITIEPAIAESGWHMPVPAVAMIISSGGDDEIEVALSSSEAIELARQLFQAANAAARFMPDPNLN